MLILASMLVMILSLAAYIILVHRSYIRNIKESICVLLVSLSMNGAAFAVCLYYAHYAASNYFLNKFFFFSNSLLQLFKHIPGDIFVIGNLLTMSRLLFIVGIYTFCTFVVDGRLCPRDIIWLFLPAVISLMNLSPIYILIIRLFKLMPWSLYRLLQYYDKLNRFCILPTVTMLVIKLLRYFKRTSNDPLRRNTCVLLFAVPLVCVEFLLILDLMPSSAANVYNTPSLMHIMNRLLMQAVRNPLMYLLCFACVLAISLSFAAVIFSSVYIIKWKNYQKVTSIEVNKSIPISDAQSLIPFIHSLKNQLVSLAHFEEMMTQDNRQEVFDLIQSLTKQMICTVDNIYDNSQEIQLHIGLHNVSDCIRAAADQVRKKTSVPIEYIAAKSALAMVDPFFMQHALENILYNAADACEHKPGGCIQIYVERSRRYMTICVRDNGVGIPKQDIEKVMEPFFSTKAKSHSWGMGLNHVRKIVNAHDGHIRLDSEVGVGTTVSIRLPIGK